MKKSLVTLGLLATFSIAAFALLICGNAVADTSQKPEQATTAAQADAPQWLTSTTEVLDLAKKENKYVMINFTGSDWCPPCIQLKKQVFDSAEFKDFAAKKLVLQIADFPRNIQQPAPLKQQNEALLQKYGVYGFPTLVILDPEGKAVGRLGYTPGGPKPFIKQVEKIISR